MSSITVSIIGALIAFLSLFISFITFINNIYKEWIAIDVIYDFHYSPAAVKEVVDNDGVPQKPTIDATTHYGMFLFVVKAHNNSKLDVGFHNLHVSFLDKNGEYKKLTHISPTDLKINVIMNSEFHPEYSTLDRRISTNTQKICDGIGTFKSNSWTTYNFLVSLIHQPNPTSDIEYLSEKFKKGEEVTLKISLETIRPRNFFIFRQSELVKPEIIKYNSGIPYHKIY